MRATLSLFKSVTILGSSGNIGQPLSLAMVQSPHVTDLRLYDRSDASGIAADLSHMPVPVRVRGFGPRDLDKALKGADLVLIPAGLSRKPGMTRDDLFNTNALTVEELTLGVAQYAPNAIIGLITNPLNSMISVAAETLRRKGVFDPRKLLGVTALDVIRARTFLSNMVGINASELRVPLIGGHSGQTIVPLFSQSGIALSAQQIEFLTHRVRRGGDDVVRAKAGAGSASLTMAYASAKWSASVLRALKGDRGMVECSLVKSPLMEPKVEFFASLIALGTEGVERVLPLPPLSPYEEEQLDRCLPDLEMNIRKGVEFVASRQQQ
ncbi:malate dehydrogenase [Strigomonas culicis]|uniref:malate dehydrogenase n=2 Tax=Strigomonas culicis TaxID=28005 RepID=S9V8D0_9TRYP|nr:malate dehydrogenase [Strigomonas culicis]|eukprot:EPY19205.1 malate dehydrogenase [Strigomonas culicis]